MQVYFVVAGSRAPGYLERWALMVAPIHQTASVKNGGGGQWSARRLIVDVLKESVFLRKTWNG